MRVNAREEENRQERQPRDLFLWRLDVSRLWASPLAGTCAGERHFRWWFLRLSPKPVISIDNSPRHGERGGPRPLKMAWGSLLFFGKDACHEKFSRIEWEKRGARGSAPLRQNVLPSLGSLDV
jgi:hypothetical protein